MTHAENRPSPWELLYALQRRLFAATDLAELGFILANEAWHLVPYRQASVFLFDRLGQPELRAVTGLPAIAEETPFTLWLGRLCAALSGDAASPPATRRIAAAMVADDLREGWGEWWPANGLYVPLVAADGRVIGAVLYARDEAYSDADAQWLAMLHETAAYCLARLRGPRRTWREVVEQLRNQPQRVKRIALAAAVVLLLPVRLSVIAPSEIVALQAEAVAAPMDGVVKTFHVAPNEAVKENDLLFSLDATTLRNRRDVAEKALAVARADALVAQQKAFDNVQSKSEMATLMGRVREKEAELAFLDESLARIDVRAAHDGVFAYGDPNDWLGKPVTTGERIAQLAQPNALGVVVWIPLADAINLEAGASMRVYLQTAPLSALSATLTQTSYQAALSPDGVASYRVRGKLDDAGDARIGLRGVTKVYGAWRPLVYWALRRPLGALRQWVGV